ncbi:hypothetical protein KY325_02835 [Candidatus Woesearchaeota archaeon]|nr:hypothetical protein [Candidatus Woesearchaeota archaeon]
MRKTVFFAILVSIFLLSLAIATADELDFDTIDAYVNGALYSNIEMDSGKLEVSPGDLLQFIINVENKYLKSERMEIDAIDMTVTINDIRGTDDLYFEFRDFGLDEGEETNKEVTFNIPEDVAPGEYIVEMRAAGTDDDGNLQNARFVFPLSVLRKQRELYLYKPSIVPAGVLCGESTQLSLKLENRGKLADTVRITVLNGVLGIDLKDSDTVKSHPEVYVLDKSYTLHIADAVEGGVYPINVIVDYTGGQLIESIDLLVTCPSAYDLTQGKAKELKPEEYATGFQVANVGKEDKSRPLSGFFTRNKSEIAILSGIGIFVIAVIMLLVAVVGFSSKRR